MIRMRSFPNRNTKKLAVVAHVLQTTQSLVISSCCFADDGREMYQELKRKRTAIVLGQVVQKPVNVNPGLNVNCTIIFSCLKMFLTSNGWYSLRLPQHKIAGQTI